MTRLQRPIVLVLLQLLRHLQFAMDEWGAAFGVTGARFVLIRNPAANPSECSTTPRSSNALVASIVEGMGNGTMVADCLHTASASKSSTIANYPFDMYRKVISWIDGPGFVGMARRAIVSENAMVREQPNENTRPERGW